MNRSAWISAGIALVLGLGAARADVLELRDGTRIQGSFRGADADSIHFETDQEVHLVAIDKARSVEFGDSPTVAREAAPSRRPEPAPHPTLAEATRPTAPAPAPAPPAASPPAEAAVRTVEIPVGTLLRVRIGDTVDPRIGAEGDRFAGLLETGLAAGGVPVIPARTRVYGVVSEARTQGPIASRLKLELTEVMLGGEMLSVVSGTHAVIELPGTGAGPAKAAPARPDRIPAGSLLEFRLLQAVELTLR